VVTYRGNDSRAEVLCTKVLFELRRTTLFAIGLGAFVVLWFLPDVVSLITRKPDEVWARVQQTQVIHFAINPTYMPFDGLGSHGDFFGIDVDIANELARRLSARAEFVITSYDSLYDILRVGQADATISALPIDPAKLGLWAYSEPYFEAGQVLVTNPVRVPKFSRGSIAVEFGSDADAAARYLARRHEGVEIKYTQSAEDALKAVSNGWTDAAIIDGVSVKQLLPKFLDLQIAEQVTSDPYAIAVWGESTQLLEAINAKLAQMKQDGTIQRIVEEWVKK
jgi:polar amino acid transport system substrate-binding protein